MQHRGKVDTVSQADIIRTSRDQTLVYPVMTQVALLCDTLVFVKGNGLIGTFINAGPAPGAQVVIHDDEAVIPLPDSRFRTGFDTGRFIAVAAQVDLKYKFRLISEPLRPVLLNRNQFNTISGPVLLFAGHFASSATPT